jgi:hypothetical protein
MCSLVRRLATYDTRGGMLMIVTSVDLGAAFGYAAYPLDADCCPR